jgi:hypothetical protein
VSCQDENAERGYQTLDTRRSWHCGFLPPEEWTAHYWNDPNAFDGAWRMPDGSACDGCPGYFTQLPQIREAQEACWALRKGVLAIYYPDAPAVLLEAAKIADIAHSNHEAMRMAKTGS